MCGLVVCEEVVCVDKLCVSKLCVRKLCVRKLCDVVCEGEVGGGRGGGAEGRRECTTKNKNPTQRCGRKVAFRSGVSMIVEELTKHHHIHYISPWNSIGPTKGGRCTEALF